MPALQNMHAVVATPDRSQQSTWLKLPPLS
jgi:hypothetical protein